MATTYAPPAQQNMQSSTLLDKLGMLTVLAICFVAPWGTFRQFAPLLTFATVPILVLAALVAFRLMAKGNRLEPFDALILPILFIVAASSLWSDFIPAWDEHAFWYFASAATYLGVRLFLRNAGDLRSIATVSALGGFIAIAMIEPGQPSLEFGGGILRPGVPGHNSNFTAYSLAGAIFLLLTVARHLAKNRIERVAAFAACAVLFYGILYLDTRGALISVGLMALWYIVSSWGLGKVAHLAVWPAFAFTMLFSLGLLEWVGPAVEALVPSDRQSGDLSGRIPTWQTARALIGEDPLLGVGPGGFEILSPYGIGAHNLFLTLALDLGLIGLALFMLLLTRGLWRGLIADGTEADKSFVTLFACYFLPIAATGHFEVAPFTWVVLATTFSALRD